MKNYEYYDVVVIGGGPAGLAAAEEADRQGASVLLLDREARLGGILKQCIHDGFGLVRFGKKMAGPEYAQVFIDALEGTRIDVSTLTFATRVEKQSDGFRLTLVCRGGLRYVAARALVLSTGCRERTARQIGVHGARPAGIYTAGAAQNYTNLCGKLPTRKCVVLGSGDIGLIMARRLTLEGAEVLGVYEAKPEPSGLTRNISQCLDDFGIPLYTSKTVTRVFGEGRLSAVEISDVDEKMAPIPGTETVLECDALILSVGLIPENEIAETLKVPLDPRTRGPVTDQNCQTLVDGVFVCGNAWHVNDLVDYVSESGETAGRSAALYRGDPRSSAELKAGKGFLYLVPQRLELSGAQKATVFFRSRAEMGRSRLTVTVDGKELLKKSYNQLRPPEMQRLEIDFSAAGPTPGSEILFELEEAKA